MVAVHVIVILAVLLNCIYGKIRRELILERVELTYANDKYGFGSVGLKKLDRNTFAMWARMNLTQDIPSDVIAKIIVYKFDNGVYKETAITIQKNLCAFLSQDFRLIWGTLIADNGILKNFVQKCPINKGYYYFDNGLIPKEMIYLPPWRIKSTWTMYNSKDKFFVVDAYSGYKEIVY